MKLSKNHIAIHIYRIKVIQMYRIMTLKSCLSTESQEKTHKNTVYYIHFGFNGVRHISSVGFFATGQTNEERFLKWNFQSGNYDYQVIDFYR